MTSSEPVLTQAVDHDTAADRIADAFRSGEWLHNLAGVACPPTLSDGYEIQERVAQRLEADPAGWKLGCTSAATQQLLGCDEPIVARIFKDFVLPSPATCSALRQDMLYIEAEISFRLHSDLPPRRTAYSRNEVAEAIGWVMPSIEIIQSRFADWRQISLPEVVADFAGHGRLILGAEKRYGIDLDLPAVAVTITDHGTGIAEGLGGNVMGDPIEAVQWLANFNSRRNIGLLAGDLIAAGTCTGMSVVPAEAFVVASFDGLGNVELRL